MRILPAAFTSSFRPLYCPRDVGSESLKCSRFILQEVRTLVKFYAVKGSLYASKPNVLKIHFVFLFHPELAFFFEKESRKNFVRPALIKGKRLFRLDFDQNLHLKNFRKSSLRCRSVHDRSLCGYLGKWQLLELLAPYLRLFSFCDYTIAHPCGFVYSQFPQPYKELFVHI